MSTGTCELQEVDDMNYYLSNMCGQEISRGRFGVVFQHQGSCAMKVVQRAPSRLVLQAGGALQEDTELELQRQLEHSCILPLLKVVQDSFQRGYLLPLAAQGDLMHILLAMGALKSVDGIALARPIASALTYMHEVTVAHLDVKPENMLLMGDELLFSSVFLADFGCACSSMQPYTGCSTIAGTVTYWAPEIYEVRCQRRASYGHCVDCWAFGVTMYSAFCGEEPFEEALSQTSPPEFLFELSCHSWQSLRPCIQRMLFALMEVDDSLRLP